MGGGKKLFRGHRPHGLVCNAGIGTGYKEKEEKAHGTARWPISWFYVNISVNIRETLVNH